MLIEKCKQSAKIRNNHRDHSQVWFTYEMKYCLPLRRLQQLHQWHPSAHSFTTISILISMMMVLFSLCSVDTAGYSYTRFIGPVAGPEEKIFVNDANSYSEGKPKKHRGSDALRLDYFGKPEYDFAYGVEDADAHVLHNRNEMRDGDTVKGVYSLIDPDGTLRVVKYTADEINGFRAEVVRNEVPLQQHGQLQNYYNPEPPAKTIVYNFEDHYDGKDKPHHHSKSKTRLRGDGMANNHPSSNKYKAKLERVQRKNHQTPSQPHIIYNYNKNYDNDGNDHAHAHDTDDGGSYHDDEATHYEVHEKPDDYSEENEYHRPQYKVHEKPDYSDEDDEEDLKLAINKKKPHHRHADRDDDDYYYNDDDSEETDDFGLSFHNSEESNEYY